MKSGVTTTDCVHCTELALSVEAAHERSLLALTNLNTPRLAAVAWLSAHVAAVDNVLLPIMRQRSIASRQELREQRAVNRRLQRETRVLEQVLAGDALVARVDALGARDRVVSALAQHAAGEHLLLDRLAQDLGATLTDQVAARYVHALVAGPSRPHPYLPTGMGKLGTALASAASVRDHLLDRLDGRPSPIPRQRPARPEPGRWGHYLLGSPFSSEPDDEVWPNRR